MNSATNYGYEARKMMATALREATKDAKAEFEAAHKAWQEDETRWDDREAARARYLDLADAQP